MASGKKAQGGSANSIWYLSASAPNEVWSYDKPRRPQHRYK
jgi:hypothetical protein